jgi:hypothetical protein
MVSDRVSNRVFNFLDSMDAKRLQSLHESHRTVRNIVQTEIRGCMEFINVNGRLYRYGVVSADNRRTQQCVKALVPSLDEFNRVFNMHVQSWDQVTPYKLKSHLQITLNRESYRMLPAPVVAINAQTLEWLRGVYVSLHRLNSHWGTQFKRWEDVAIDADSDTHQDVLKEITQDDIAQLELMMKTLTKHAMAAVTKTPTNYDDVGCTQHTHAQHGMVEMLFARITKLHKRDTRNMYVMMLLYLAHSYRTHTFSPLPPGKHHTHGPITREFLDNYYASDNELTRYWGGEDPIAQIPMSSIASLSEFEHLTRSLE